MTDRVDDGGWAHFASGSDDMYIKFKEALWDVVRAPTVNHYEGGYNLHYDLLKKYLVLTLKMVYLPSYDSLQKFIKYMNDWQDSGDIEVGIKRNTSDDYIEMKGDGEGTIFNMVMPEGIKQAQKISVEDQQVYIIKMLKLTE